MDFYNTYVNDMNDVISLVNSTSSSWNNFKTTVQNNSSFWIQPMSIIYPKILPNPFVDSYLTDITSWLNENYPIQNTKNNTTIYAENEKVVVNVYTYIEQVQINSYDYLVDTVTCYTLNSTICANCKTTYYGLVGCHQGLFDCARDEKCHSCKTSDCEYTVPYFNVRNGGNGTYYADSRIDAYVSMYFKDRWEYENIKSISYKVIDCKWTFDKFIGA
jgi:hypothetical protein